MPQQQPWPNIQPANFSSEPLLLQRSTCSLQSTRVPPLSLQALPWRLPSLGKRLSCLQKFAKSRKSSGRSSMASLHPPQSPCRAKTGGSSAWLLCANQQLQQSHSHQWRLQLGHVKRLSPSACPFPLQRSSQLWLYSTRNGLGQGKDGLRSCGAILTGRSRGRMARSSVPCSCMPFCSHSGGCISAPHPPR